MLLIISMYCHYSLCVCVCVTLDVKLLITCKTPSPFKALIISLGFCRNSKLFPYPTHIEIVLHVTVVCVCVCNGVMV